MGSLIPALDFIGPATWTGLLVVQAAGRIRAEGGGFTREQLARHYLEPLRQSTCWQDAAFWQRWPGYLRRSRALFTRSLDLTLGAAEVWMSPSAPAVKVLRWCRLLAEPGASGWMDLRSDTLALGWALRLRDVLTRPSVGWVLFNGLLNSLRDLMRHPRANLPEGGRLRVHYQGQAGSRRQPPTVLRHWYGRIRPILEASARLLYRSEPRPFRDKIAAMTQLLLQQLNLFDLLAAGFLALLSVVGALLVTAGRTLLRLLRRPAPVLASPAPAYDGAAGRRPVEDGQRLPSNPGIHVLWPRGLPDYRTLREQGLEQVCPAGVFDLRPPTTAIPVQVSAHRCIQCETCWRVSTLVDWARDPRRRLVYPVISPVLTRLLRSQDEAALVQPTPPRKVDPWSELDGQQAPSLGGSSRAQLAAVLDQLEHKLEELDRALEREPGLVDRGRGEHLDMLVRSAHVLAQDTLALVENAGLAQSPVLSLAREMVSCSQERQRRTWEGRLAWAAADGRYIRQHHLTGLRRLLALAAPSAVSPASRLSGTALLLHRIAEEVEPVAGDQATAIGCLMAAIGARCLVAEVVASRKNGPLRRALAAELHRSAASCVCELQELTTKPGQEVLTELLPLSAADRADPGESTREYVQLGKQLLDAGGGAQDLLGRLGSMAGVTGRLHLQVEQEELERAQGRLAELVQQGGHEDEIAERLGREAAALLGGRLLVAWIERRLEQGDDAELETVLLRVWLDEREVALSFLASLVRRRRQGLPWQGDRPLVEPDVPPPERAVAEYLAVPLSAAAGDFLLAAVDLRQPRLVPEMMAAPPQELAAALAALAPNAGAKPRNMLCKERGEGEAPAEPQSTPGASGSAGASPSRPPALAQNVPGSCTSNQGPLSDLGSLLPLLEHLVKLTPPEEILFLATSVVTQQVGRWLRHDAPGLELEQACAEVILRELILERDTLAGGMAPESAGIPPHSVHPQLAVLHAIVVHVLAGLWQKPAPRHLGHEALELESLKGAWRQSVQRAGDVFQSGRWENPSVQVSCLALAAATAWLLAADRVLGRLAWLDRAAAEDDLLPPARQAGLYALARCQDTVRDALRRFDEDLAALRRGYVSPLLRVGPLLRRATAEETLPACDIRGPLAILVLIEPQPVVLPPPEGEQVLELYWDLSPSDQAALENALRLRQAAPQRVRLHVVALGPRRIGPVLRQLHSLQIEPVDLLVHDGTSSTSEAAAAVMRIVAQAGPFDLLLAGDRQLAQVLADKMTLPLAGHAQVILVQGEQLVLTGLDGQAGRSRPQPAAVLVQPGLPLRPFDLAGYLHGLSSSPRLQDR
jgi:hypothetical protein